MPLMPPGESRQMVPHVRLCGRGTDKSVVLAISWWDLGSTDALCPTPRWIPSRYDASRFPWCSRWVSITSLCTTPIDLGGLISFPSHPGLQYAPWFPSPGHASRLQARYAPRRVPSSGNASWVSVRPFCMPRYRTEPPSSTSQFPHEASSVDDHAQSSQKEPRPPPRLPSIHPFDNPLDPTPSYQLGSMGHDMHYLWLVL